MSESMKPLFGLIRRPWGVFYLKNKIAGVQISLKTRDPVEAKRLLQAQNDAQSQPHFNLALARVYINGADPKLATRTWQEVMEHIVAKKTDETRRRWEVAIKDRNFDCIRRLAVAETRPEHFDRALADGKVSTNVYLRRLHNHALGMEWLLKSVIPRLQWPRPVFKSKRAITAEEHAAIVDREMNPERRDFYELLWHTGASQSDAACLMAEDVDWTQRTIAYSRMKLKSRGTGIKPALIRFGEDVAAILKRRPATGPLFPYLRTVRAGDRATEFKQRCDGLGIKGVSLHSYRYAWSEMSLHSKGGTGFTGLPSRRLRADLAVLLRSGRPLVGGLERRLGRSGRVLACGDAGPLGHSFRIADRGLLQQAIQLGLCLSSLLGVLVLLLQDFLQLGHSILNAQLLFASKFSVLLKLPFLDLELVHFFHIGPLQSVKRADRQREVRPCSGSFCLLTSRPASLKVELYETY